MARTWKALILVVGLAVVSCLARRHPSYDDIVAKALKFYNEVQQGRPLFRLLESTPPPRVSVWEAGTTGYFTPVRMTGGRECLT
jgi:hypothetical protein